MLTDVWPRVGSPTPRARSTYYASKAAVSRFTDSLMNLISTRIREVEVDPGKIEAVSACLPQDITVPSTAEDMLLTRGLGVLCGEIQR